MSLYIAFEGNDGTGKSTIINKIYDKIRSKYEEANVTTMQQPGHTHLGKHIRELVKNPAQFNRFIEMDDTSRQLLYMVDAINAIKTFVEPALDSGSIILSDRSTFISTIVHGLSDGLDISTIKKMSTIIDPPMLDKLYILHCPHEAKINRVKRRNKEQVDHYDSQSEEYHRKRDDIYLNIIKYAPPDMISRIVEPSSIKYINTDRDIESITNEIFSDLDPLIAKDMSQAL